MSAGSKRSEAHPGCAEADIWLIVQPAKFLMLEKKLHRKHQAPCGYARKPHQKRLLKTCRSGGAFRNSAEAVILNARPMSYREASPPILFREPDGSQIRKPATKSGPTIRDQGEALAGVHAVLHLSAIAVLKRGEGGSFGIKAGIKPAGRKGKVLVQQRIIGGFDP